MGLRRLEFGEPYSYLVIIVRIVPPRGKQSGHMVEHLSQANLSMSITRSKEPKPARARVVRLTRSMRIIDSSMR